MPVRVQLSRAKGWRMPENTVKVARPTRWGNPVKVGEPHPYCLPEEIALGLDCAKPLTAAEAVDIYRCFYFDPADLETLRGKNLACFCKLDAPCHADVLLELANQHGGGDG
jgi:hypothetical protein